MPPYRPPNKVTTTQIPWLAEIIAADPDWERLKHQEVEYYFSSNARTRYVDPQIRGAFNTPRKTTFVNYSGPAIFAAGDLTGIGNDFVITVSDSSTPGMLTMRSAAQMFSDIAGAVPNLGYALRLVNLGSGDSLQLGLGAGTTLFDSAWWGQQLTMDEISRGNFTDYQVQFPDSAHMMMRRVAINQPYSSIVG